MEHPVMFTFHDYRSNKGQKLATKVIYDVIKRQLCMQTNNCIRKEGGSFIALDVV